MTIRSAVQLRMDRVANESTIKPKTEQVHGFEPEVFFALILICLRERPTREVDTDGAQGFRRKCARFGFHKFEFCPFGFFVVEDVEHDARAETRRADAVACVAHHVSGLAVMRRSPKRTESRARVDRSAPSVGEADSRQCGEGLEEVLR